MFTNYKDKIKSLEVELQRVKKEILLLNNFGGHVRKAFDIEQTVFDLRVAIYHLMEQKKEEPAPHVYGMPVMGNVNLPQIETPTFDGNMLNW